MKDWVQPYLQQYKGRILLSLLFGVLGIGSGAMLLFVSGYLISKSALQPVNIMIVYVPIVSVRAFSIGQAVFLYLEKLVGHDIVLRILEKMRTKLYHIVEPQALFLRSRYQTGDLLGILSDDIEHLQDLYIRTIFPAILGLTTYSIIIAVIGYFDWTFAIMMGLMLGMLVFFIPIVSFYVTRRYQTSIKQKRNTLYQHLTDAIFGLVDWQASGREGELLDLAKNKDAEIITVERKIQHWHYLRDAVIQLIIGIAIIAMIIWSGLQANQGIITATVIAAFILMIFSITDALVPISEAVEQVPTYFDSIQRIKQVENKHVQEDYFFNPEWTEEKHAVLRLDNVSYQYPNSPEEVIRNLSLTIPAGKKIAILGRSGTGKSTLLKLLAGAIRPSNGTITLNGNEMHSGLLSKAVSVLNQKPHLFDTTIKNNIRIGNPSASDEDVIRAAEQAQLASLIDSLPEGINTPMREMGHRFSGGERQRIAFARVLLQDTPIILVDEATIGLDPKTEHELLDTMLTATKNKTVIWVTHHLAGAYAMDDIIFLQEGQISMQGTHHQLLKKNEHYQKLYAMDQGV